MSILGICSNLKQTHENQKIKLLHFLGCWKGVIIIVNKTQFVCNMENKIFLSIELIKKLKNGIL